MMIWLRTLFFVICAGALAGCSGMNQTQQRTLSGGAIGAAGGAALTAITGGPVLLGTALGAGVGAVAGAVTSH
jgi:osmotically inducible lipoprotein OsmB